MTWGFVLWDSGEACLGGFGPSAGGVGSCANVVVASAIDRKRAAKPGWGKVAQRILDDDRSLHSFVKVSLQVKSRPLSCRPGYCSQK